MPTLFDTDKPKPVQQMSDDEIIIEWWEGQLAGLDLASLELIAARNDISANARKAAQNLIGKARNNAV